MILKIILAFFSLLIISSCESANSKSSQKDRFEIGDFDERGQKTGLWKEYNQDSILISVKDYLNDTILADLDVQDFEFKDILIKSENLSLKLPQKWDYSIYSDSSVLFVASKNVSEKEIFAPNFDILKVDNVDLKSTVNVVINTLLSQYEKSMIHYRNWTQINGLQAFVVNFSTFEKGERQTGIIVWYDYNDDVYIFTALARNQEKNEFFKYNAIFAEIANSIRFNQ